MARSAAAAASQLHTARALHWQSDVLHKILARQTGQLNGINIFRDHNLKAKKYGTKDRSVIYSCQNVSSEQRRKFHAKYIGIDDYF